MFKCRNLFLVGSCYWHTFRLISYRRESRLAGVLYFHPISNIEMFRLSSMKSNYPKCLCQNELNRVTLTTTMWGSIYERIGALNEDELKRLCKPLIDDGLSVKRFLNDSSSAFGILHPIVQAASSRQSTIGRALVVGRSLASMAIKNLQRDSPPIIMYERSNSSWSTDAYSGSRIIGRYRCGKSQVWVLAIVIMVH